MTMLGTLASRTEIVFVGEGECSSTSGSQASMNPANAPAEEASYRSRWLSASMDSLADLSFSLSLGETLERAAEEAVTLLRLALKLWMYLGLGEYRAT